MRVILTQQTPNPIDTIANIASICYDSNPKDHMKLVQHLYKSGHHSVFEHIYFTFRIDGISRACSHQLVRHRMCSFTQRSQRYCSEEEFDIVSPVPIEEDDFTYMSYKDVAFHCKNVYNVLTKRGIKNEDARYILPNACETSLYISCNLRELIHICNERLCSRAQWEIRQLVQEMVKVVHPDLRFMLVPKCKSDRIICHTPCNNTTK